jgi:DNA-binding SARP family transcriptional activator
VAVKFSLLGPLEVRDSTGRPVDLGSRRQRALLALLLLDANRVVAVDRLIDGLWGEAAPPKAAASIQSYVSNLRRVLEPDRPPRSPARMLVSRVPGYAIVIERDQLDVLAFEDLVASARAASGEDPHRALAELDDALALWRGAALAEFADDPFATGELARLEERRAAAEEDRIDVLLRLGQLDAAIADLGRLVEQQPLRERRQRQLVTALYLSGRQTDALEAHRRHVAHLAEEFGLDPSPEFLALRDAVLRHEIALEPAPPAPARTTRPDETAPAPVFELIGRDEELARFDELLDVTLRGSGGIILVSGEPGIGKTRLLETMLERAASRDMLTALGRCYEGGAAPAFWPFVEAARALHASADDDLAELTGRLLAAVQPERSDLAGTDQVAAVMQPASRFLVADEITAALKAIAEHRPVMVGLDDVYGADPDSLEALVRLGSMLPSVPAVVVATLRTAELPADHPLAAALGELGRIPDVERIDPRPLDVEETRRLLSRESFAETDLDTASRIHERTDGNPFFTVEMARLLRSDQADPDREIPAGVRDVLRLRLGRLPEETQAVLRAAAVYGRTFPLDVVAAVQRAAEAETLDHLERALASQLVGEDVRTGDYRFTHVLVQQAIADSMTALRRSHLHAAVAGVLTPRAQQRPDLWVEVAHHAVEAIPVTGPEPAVEPLARAAVHAVAVNAHELAQQLVERRLQVIATLPPGPDRDVTELCAQVDLCAVLPITTGWHTPRLQAASRRVQELGRATGDLDAVTRGLSAGSSHSTVSGRYDESREIFTRQEAIYERTRRSDHGFLMMHGISMVHLFAGELDEAETAYRQSDEFLAVADPGDGAALRIPPEGMAGAAHHASLWALVRWLAGDSDGAASLVARARGIAHRDGHLQTIWAVWLSRMIVDYFAGDAAAAVAGDQERREAAATLRSPLVDALIGVPAGWGAAALGDASACRVIAGLIDDLTNSGALVFGATYRGMLADAELRHGNDEAARVAADDGIAFAERVGERMWLGELQRLRATALRRLGRTDEAREAVGAAWTTIVTQGAWGLRSRIAAEADELGITLEDSKPTTRDLQVT